MATIWVQDEPAGLVSGLRIEASHPAAAAVVVDTLVTAIAQPSDGVTGWALHPYEQDGMADQAYANERRELGDDAMVYVEELTRPRQHGVVWVDRYHLIASGCSARTAHRLCGLYVAGDGGQCVCLIHDPSVSHVMHEHVRAIAHGTTTSWDDQTIAMSCRLALRVGTHPNTVQLRLPPMLLGAAHAAIDQARSHVASW